MSTEMPSIATVPSTTISIIRTRTAWKLLSAARTSHMDGLGGTCHWGQDFGLYSASTLGAKTPARAGDPDWQIAVPKKTDGRGVEGAPVSTGDNSLPLSRPARSAGRGAAGSAGGAAAARTDGSP